MKGFLRYYFFLNCSKILLKIFNNLCPFPSLMTITGQRNFLSRADGLVDRIFETKNVLEFL